MANLALNINVKWRVVLGLLVVSLVVIYFFLPSFKSWTGAGSGTDETVQLDQQSLGKENAQTLHAESEIQEKYLSWDGNEKGIFYYEFVPKSSPPLTVLLLHGDRLTSENWLQTKTIQSLSSKGYRIVAVDLPHHGKSIRVADPLTKKAEFLHSLIVKMKLERLVLVAPSMSGSYALPFIIKHVGDPNLIRGFVPIAPAETQSYAERLKTIKLPTLVVYGENDEGYKDDVEKLKNIAESEEFMMKGASHACYIDYPKEFNVRLGEFLEKVAKGS